MGRWLFDILFDGICVLILLFLVWIAWHGFYIESGVIVIEVKGIGWYFQAER